MYYVRSSNSLYLINDAANGAQPGVINPGTAGAPVSNSQCSIANAGPVTTSGNALTVPVSVTFASSFTGAKNVYGLATNDAGASSDWNTLGTWTPSASQIPAAVSVTPVNGHGASQTFTATYSDPAGAADLNVSYLLFNSSLSGPGGCWIYYVQSTSSLYLINDAATGTQPGSVTPGVAGASVSNNQCAISNGGAVTAAGTTLAVPVTVTFSPGFTGTKNVYALTINNASVSSPWQTMGTWGPQ